MEFFKVLIQEIWSKHRWLIILVAVAFVAGYLIASPQKAPTDAPALKKAQIETEHVHKTSDEAVQTIWTCSMHPQIRLPNPGKCPICFMELIPLDSGVTGSSQEESRQVSMSETAMKLAQVETTPVIRAFPKYQISMVGMVFEDETRVAALTSRVEGRLDEVFVNFTGVQVNKGDPMVKIWSPTLIRSQVELFETIKGSGANDGVIRGAEEKLIQYGLTRDQIHEIRNNNKPMVNVTLQAPIKGIVTKKNAVLGQFVREGAEMFIINDLSRVWVKLDAYETDIPWIRYGQDVTFTASAIPGKVFSGKVLFIDPVLDTKTRSVKIRVEAENPEFLLKPGMFVSARLEAELDSQVRVIKPDWAGKYICPVHPRDEASDTPGSCPESNMPLRPASSFGYSENPSPTPPLLIPAAAPLITGKRAIVFVQQTDKKTPTYELREVSLGPKTGSQYIVLSGLKEGERVVSKGAFKLDSAMQISAKQSMMNESIPTGGKSYSGQKEEELVERIDVSDALRKNLDIAINHYLKLTKTLVDENADESKLYAGSLIQSLKDISLEKESKTAQDYWNIHSRPLADALGRMENTDQIQQIRRAFESVSESMARIVMSFGHSLGADLKLYHCPMAFDGSGAYWLELGDNKTNPYFGKKPYKGQDMLKCGELQETIRPVTGQSGISDSRGEK